MRKMQILGVLLAFIITFTALVPAPLEWGVTTAAAKATVSKLTIDNKTTKVLTITIKGPRSYTIYALPGKTEKDIAAGKYTYEYEACGVKKTGKLSATTSKSKLQIKACPSTKLLLINAGTTPVSLTLTGPERYFWSIPPNTKMRVVVVKGKYKWSAFWCGKSDSGTFLIKKPSYFAFWCSK